jgi:microcystin-dependent protein
MSEPFLGEIRTFGFNFAPFGWAECDGALLDISQNTALFSLLGTFYGGNGTSNFALPNLQGRVTIHEDGNNFVQGQTGGETAVTLTTNQIPSHSHPVKANSLGASDPSPGNNFPAMEPTGTSAFYRPTTDGTTMNAGVIGVAGGSQPHDNMPPYLVLMQCIALSGIFPSRA